MADGIARVQGRPRKRKCELCGSLDVSSKHKFLTAQLEGNAGWETLFVHFSHRGKSSESLSDGFTWDKGFYYICSNHYNQRKTRGRRHPAATPDQFLVLPPNAKDSVQVLLSSPAGNGRHGSAQLPDVATPEQALAGRDRSGSGTRSSGRGRDTDDIAGSSDRRKGRRRYNRTPAQPSRREDPPEAAGPDTAGVSIPENAVEVLEGCLVLDLRADLQEQLLKAPFRWSVVPDDTAGGAVRIKLEVSVEVDAQEFFGVGTPSFDPVPTRVPNADATQIVSVRGREMGPDARAALAVPGPWYENLDRVKTFHHIASHPTRWAKQLGFQTFSQLITVLHSFHIARPELETARGVRNGRGNRRDPNIVASAPRVTPAKITRTYRDEDMLLEDKIRLMLLWLRHGLSFSYLAADNNIHHSTVARAVLTALKIFDEMADLFLSEYEPAEAVFAQLTDHQKVNCGNVYVLIDCFEIPLEASTDPNLQKATHSDYKGYNTGKILVATSPVDGRVVFVSRCYPGGLTDKDIVKASNFLPWVKKQAGVPDSIVDPDFGFLNIVADRGFTIGYVAKQVAPWMQVVTPSKRTKAQGVLSSQQATRSEAIASVRMHVERTIGRMRNFAILNRTFKCSQLYLISAVVRVVAFLAQFSGEVSGKTDGPSPSGHDPGRPFTTRPASPPTARRLSMSDGTSADDNDDGGEEETFADEVDRAIAGDENWWGDRRDQHDSDDMDYNNDNANGSWSDGGGSHGGQEYGFIH